MENPRLGDALTIGHIALLQAERFNIQIDRTYARELATRIADFVHDNILLPDYEAKKDEFIFTITEEIKNLKS